MKFSAKFYFVIVCVFYVFFNYAYMLDHPLGVHFIRQTDSISFILYYFGKNNYNLFDIGNLNLGFVNGKTACEFPIIYYVFFIVFKICGVNFELVRWGSLLLSTVSIYYLLKTTLGFVKNIFISICLVLMIISSSVFRYYSINFLPDSFALACTFISFYHFFEFTKLENKKSFKYIYLFSIFAALIKVYFGLYLIAISVYLFFHFKTSIKKNLYFSLISFVIVACWYSFSVYYNWKNHSTYYLTHILPIWSMSYFEISRVFNVIWNFWYNKYYLATLFHTFFVLALLYLMPLKNKNLNNYSSFLCLCLLGCMCYFTLFFKQFRDHDYYFLPFIPFLYLLAVLSITKALSLTKNRLFLVALTSFLALISVIGFNYTSIVLHRRFENSIDKFSLVGYELKGVQVFLKDSRISENAKFIVIGDQTLNGSLVCLNRFGWTYPSFDMDIESIKSNLPLADFLVVLRPSENRLPSELEERLSKCTKLTFGGNYIYALR